MPIPLPKQLLYDVSKLPRASTPNLHCMEYITFENIAHVSGERGSQSVYPESVGQIRSISAKKASQVSIIYEVVYVYSFTLREE